MIQRFSSVSFSLKSPYFEQALDIKFELEKLKELYWFKWSRESTLLLITIVAKNYPSQQRGCSLCVQSLGTSKPTYCFSSQINYFFRFLENFSSLKNVLT